MWVLREADAENGLTFRLTAGSVRTVGRARRADFILDAALVSRLHCRLTARADGGLEIEDLGSTNGTYVNGKKLARAELKDGDELGVGRIKLTVKRE
ncbi:MAG TPA: FHA domain-containing protein [Vicinamibacterales bacterium]|nr:FHA domain-containing protein [Vicinamibacterales bacterium]